MLIIILINAKKDVRNLEKLGKIPPECAKQNAIQDLPIGIVAFASANALTILQCGRM